MRRCEEFVRGRSDCGHRTRAQLYWRGLRRQAMARTILGNQKDWAEKNRDLLNGIHTSEDALRELAKSTAHLFRPPASENFYLISPPKEKTT